MNLGGKYLSGSEVLSDILSFVGDEEGNDVPEGFYYSQMRKALAELAYTTHFDERYYTATIVPGEKIDLPKDLFDIHRVRVFRGSICTPENSARVYSKPGAIGGGNNYFADSKLGPEQDYLSGSVQNLPTQGALLWYSENGGKLDLSSSCWSWGKAFITYAGIGSDFSSDPVIPYYLNQAIIDWVSVRALRRKMAVPGAKIGNIKALLVEAKESLEGSGLSPGSWLSAQRRVQNMSRGERDDLNLYLSSFGQPRP